MKASWLRAMERRPWVPAAVAALGTILLISSALALLAPPELLDAAVALGDRRLALALLVSFAIAASVFRLSFGRRRSAEEEVDADIAPSAQAEADGARRRRAGSETPSPGEPRGYLR